MSATVLELMEWSRSFPMSAKPWLMLGKGPSFDKFRQVDTSAYHTLALNHVVRECRVDVAHAIDLDVVTGLEEAVVENAGVLLMPLHPHVGHRPAKQSIHELAREVPVLRRMAESGRLVWYNASTSKNHAPNSPIIDVKFFSAEAALGALAAAGAKIVRSLGVDGGSNYANTFDDLRGSTLLANGHASFSRQFEGIARTIMSTGIFYAPLTVKAPVRVFVGTDAAQMLGVKLLEFSIKKHASLSVEVVPIDDSDIPVPKDPANRSRTGFSFSRFKIPELCGYKGRGIYMDADMQVFHDIRDLWTRPFGEASVLYAEGPASQGRTPQFSVLLLDCDALDWDIRKIIGGFDRGDYAYADLMQRMCIISEDRRSAGLPFEWNSLEHYEDGKTRLIHYTDMPTQPWISNSNKNGQLFYSACKEAVASGFIPEAMIYEEVEKGHVSPEFPSWIGLKDAPGKSKTERLKVWRPPYQRFVGMPKVAK